MTDANNGGVPPWVVFVLDQINPQFTALNDRLDRLVTNDAFRDEKKRVDDEFKRLNEAVREVSEGLAKEASVRAASELAAANSAANAAERAIQVQKQTNWQWFLIVAAPVASYVVGWIGAGGLA